MNFQGVTKNQKNWRMNEQYSLTTVTHFPVKLDSQRSSVHLSPFASSFSKMIQMEFGPLYEALIIDNAMLEWDDCGLIMPGQVTTKRSFKQDWKGHGI